MKKHRPGPAVSAALVALAAAASFAQGKAAAAAGPPGAVNFASAEVGDAPAGFTFARTGRGGAGKWVVSNEGGRKVLAQVSDDATSYRFPLAVYEGWSGKDVDLSVRFKPVSGQVDQAGGLVWRYRNPDNYYIVRANALEENVVLYRVEGGKRSDLPLLGEGKTYGKKAPVPKGEWSTLRVVARGDRFSVHLNGKKLYEVADRTFTGPGKVGLWTKADSVTLFDDLKIAEP